MNRPSPENHRPPSSVLLTRRECAPAIRVSVRKLDDLTKRRIIPCIRLDGKVLYRLDRVLAALDRFEQQEGHRE